MNIGMLCPIPSYNHRFLGLTQYLEERGHTVSVDSQWLNGVGNYDAIFTWNGYTPKDYRLRKWAPRRNCEVFYLEVGTFSQITHSYAVPNITIGGEHMKTVTFPTLTPEQHQHLDNLYLQYSQGRPWQGNGNYILALLQLEQDKSITKQSHFKKMQEFVTLVETTYPNHNIVFKTHPRKRQLRFRKKSSNKVARHGNLFDLIAKAELTVAVNSTALYEAAFAGCPVLALGKSPFSNHPDNPRGIVWEALHRQIPNNCPNIDTQMKLNFGDYFD